MVGMIKRRWSIIAMLVFLMIATQVAYAGDPFYCATTGEYAMKIQLDQDGQVVYVNDKLIGTVTWEEDGYFFYTTNKNGLQHRRKVTHTGEYLVHTFKPGNPPRHINGRYGRCVPGAKETPVS